MRLKKSAAFRRLHVEANMLMIIRIHDWLAACSYMLKRKNCMKCRKCNSPTIFRQQYIKAVQKSQPKNTNAYELLCNSHD